MKKSISKYLKIASNARLNCYLVTILRKSRKIQTNFFPVLDVVLNEGISALFNSATFKNWYFI